MRFTSGDGNRNLEGEKIAYHYDISHREKIPVEIDVFYSGLDLERQISGGKNIFCLYYMGPDRAEP